MLRAPDNSFQPQEEASVKMPRILKIPATNR
jgi:hypothetical protein